MKTLNPYSEYYNAGKERGRSIASWQDLPEIGSKVSRSVDWVGLGTVETVEDAEEYFLMLCSSAEENGRSYSPFEFTAKELNDRSDSEECWEHYNQGIQDGFTEEWNSRKEYYK